MNFKTDLRAAILAIPAVAEIVGIGAAGRVWDGWQRVNLLPCIVFELDSIDEQNYLESGKGDGQIAQLALTCRAETPEAADALKAALRKGIAGFHGNLDLVIDSIAESNTPKDDASTGHWYDRVFDCTAIFTEAT